MRTLSKRLLKIASYVDKGSFVADIGSDHCLLPIFLLSNGTISKAQAVDNKKGPYERMTKAIEESGYKASISASLSNGIEKLDPHVDTLILAGMGGYLICDILKAHEEKLKGINTIVVDAHSDKEEVYDTLASLSFKLEESCFLIDKGKPYDVMKWVRCAKKVSYSEEEKKYGLFNLSNPNEEWKSYCKDNLKNLYSIKTKLANNNKKLLEINKEIDELEILLKNSK